MTERVVTKLGVKEGLEELFLGMVYEGLKAKMARSRGNQPLL